MLSLFAVSAIMNFSYAFAQTEAQNCETCSLNQNAFSAIDSNKSELDPLLLSFSSLQACSKIAADIKPVQGGISSLSVTDEARACFCGVLNGSKATYHSYQELIAHPIDSLNNLYIFFANFRRNVTEVYSTIESKFKEYPNLSDAEKKVVRCDAIVQVGLGGIAVPLVAVNTLRMANVARKVVLSNNAASTASGTTVVSNSTNVISGESSSTSGGLSASALNTNIERINQAVKAIGRKATDKEASAVHKAHEIGMGEVGKDGISAAKIGNYTQAQILKKARILKVAGFNSSEIRSLMENGVVGLSEFVDMGMKVLAATENLAGNTSGAFNVNALRHHLNGNHFAGFMNSSLGHYYSKQPIKTAATGGPKVSNVTPVAKGPDQYYSTPTQKKGFYRPPSQR